MLSSTITAGIALLASAVSAIPAPAGSSLVARQATLPDECSDYCSVSAGCVCIRRPTNCTSSPLSSPPIAPIQFQPQTNNKNKTNHTIHILTPPRPRNLPHPIRRNLRHHRLHLLQLHRPRPPRVEPRAGQRMLRAPRLRPRLHQRPRLRVPWPRQGRRRLDRGARPRPRDARHRAQLHQV